MRIQILASIILAVAFTPPLRAQESASIFLNYTYNTSRQNFCSLHRQVETGVVPRRNILRNQNLHVALFNYQLNSGTGAIDPVSPGVGIRFLDELARRAGFNWRKSFGTVQSPSGNETWDSVLNSSIDGFDLVGEWYVRTSKRLDSGIIFPESWYDGSLIMVRKKTEAVDQFVFWAFLQPFDYHVWLLILGTIILSGCVYYFIDYFESRRTGTPMEGSLSENIFAASYYMAGHFELQPNSTSTHMMVSSDLH